MHAQSTMNEYLRCKETRQPFYHEIDQVVCGVVRHYVRLMLPLANTDGNVIKIAYGVRLLESFYQFSDENPANS